MRAKTIFFITIIIVITFFVFALSNNKKRQTILTYEAPVLGIPVQTEKPNIMDSPEGSKTLTLDSSLFVSSNIDGQKVNIFKKEEVASRKLEIPYNTWSPDNVYVFLKLKTLPVDDYLVFQTTGNLFPNNLNYLSIQELFKQKVPEYIIEDVTGWGGLNLIVINTKNTVEDRKVSFWFDVPSQSFIQLGTYFK